MKNKHILSILLAAILLTAACTPTKNYDSYAYYYKNYKNQKCK